jgi:hypothetical protein
LFFGESFFDGSGTKAMKKRLHPPVKSADKNRKNTLCRPKKQIKYFYHFRAKILRKILKYILIFRVVYGTIIKEFYVKMGNYLKIQ